MAEPMTTTIEEEWVPVDTFGARLALIRQAKGWNVKEAADACGLNDQSWRNWEAGGGVQKMDRVARKIAEATGVNYVWLLAGGPIRSRCIIGLPAQDGQMELALGVEPRELASVGGSR